MILRKSMPLLGMCVTFALLGFASGQDTDEAGFVPLFNGKDLTGFQLVFGGKQDSTGVFTVEDGILNVSFAGKAHGHIQTEKSYKNYVLRFDWKFQKKGGNSGCIVHANAKGGNFTQVEGWETDHGRLLGNVTDGTFDKEAMKQAVKPAEWNTTEIISKDGELTCKVNGAQVSKGKVKPAEGHIGWRAEGSPVQFKNMRIKVME